LNTNIFNSIQLLFIYEVIKECIKNIKYVNVKIPLIILSVILSIALYEFNEIQIFPFVLLFETTEYYIDIKKTFTLIKPFYISFMWVALTLIMPSVIYVNNYNILTSINEIFAPFLLIFGLTNIADIKDIDDDNKNKIITFPLYFGITKTRIISIISIGLSVIITINNM
jgi:4-hydroxybenzoate polyprenyltransferase